MNIFYFNECLPTFYNGSIQNIFESAIRKYNCIVKDKSLNFQEGIITHKMPSEIKICDTNIKTIIDACSDKDLRRAAYRYFTMYPIDSFYSLEDVFDNENVSINHTFNGHDATNLIIAHKMGWFVFSLPLCCLLETDILLVSSDKTYTHVHNWYGGNSQYLVQCVIALNGIKKSKLLELKYCFEDKECKMSDSFISNYIDAPLGLQELVIGKFKDAIKAKLLFPANHDNNLIKACKGTNNEETYELRSKAFGGIRVYFSCNENCIYIGGIGTKASSIGKEQSADISRASNEIKKMKRSSTV